MAETEKSLPIYQFHVLLRGINPPIWRRLLVRSTSTIADLHYIIQIAFSWSDFHLHRFLIRGKEYGSSRAGCTGFSTDPAQVSLADFHFRERERFLYEYDFSDLWVEPNKRRKSLIGLMAWGPAFGLSMSLPKTLPLSP